ncbi:D-cysteine desulfhydrase family protein [Vibrio sinensis]|uniref:D-cysteine desulfhydrase family protein n=1 Tax=Vibrio sinensis TaxID=2302434 RepID=A0A3A6QHQ3_9VIBR|nr:D-cysteine desulfhydrase family protein [Vibrio sinensis]RJX69397.1 D-cysteine desulfhydrase family protein [Vibrio sinensis]
MLTAKYTKAQLAHLPTPLELMPNLTKKFKGPNIYIKRDDATGLAFGGNKVRQLEYYVGRAMDLNADALLTTGAVQSNHVRQTVAAARKMGWHVEVQLEHRVDTHSKEYQESGNPYLNRLMGAKIHTYDVGEDEQGADKAMYDRAAQLKDEGYNPFVIPLSATDQTPWGSLGYVECVEELYLQSQATGLKIDAIVLGSGSANTHAGVMAGVIALGLDIPVYGFCVRRDQDAQTERVEVKTRKVLKMLDVDENKLKPGMVKCSDWVLAPGYGVPSAKVVEAIHTTAFEEGILLDPTYTGKAMCGLIGMIENGELTESQNVVFIHTGGTPSLFGYPELVEGK